MKASPSRTIFEKRALTFDGDKKAMSLIGETTGKAAADLIKDGSDASFIEDVIEASKSQPVIVDFWATWCGPCRQLGPALERAVTAAKGEVKLVKIDIANNPTYAGPLRVPGKGGGCAAAVLAAPANGTGPLLRPPGCCASPCGRRPCGPPLTPETTAAPRNRKSGQATGLPRPTAGATRPAGADHDHHNRNLHG